MALTRLFRMFRRKAGDKSFAKVALAEKIGVNPLMLRGLNLS